MENWLVKWSSSDQADHHLHDLLKQNLTRRLLWHVLHTFIKTWNFLAEMSMLALNPDANRREKRAPLLSKPGLDPARGNESKDIPPPSLHSSWVSNLDLSKITAAQTWKAEAVSTNQKQCKSNITVSRVQITVF